MPAHPLYSAKHEEPAFALRYSWCGWTSRGDFALLADEAWTKLSAAWESDGMRLLERSVAPGQIQLTFSTTPAVSPVLLAARAKGRLQHAYRAATGSHLAFSRKLAVRSVGDNTGAEVQAYVNLQVQNEQFVDQRFADFLSQFTVVSPSFDLALATETNSGRYWYNLHLVLVTDVRYRFVDEPSLTTLRDGALKIAAKKGYRIGTLSVMPDHLHVALRGSVEAPPEELALAFKNNLAFMLDRGEIWRPGYYAGTFGEYDMRAIRKSVRLESSSPAG